MSDSEEEAAAEPPEAEDGGNDPAPVHSGVETVVEALAAARAEREELEAEVNRLQEERDELEARVKRTAADFENYKKRQEKRREQVRQEATEELVERLLEVRENLKRALEQPEGDAEGLREGVELTLAEFDRVLDAEDVVEIAPEPGEEVDPQRHEVMMRVSGEQPAGTIEEVYRAGYETGEAVIRPAQVAVAEADDDEDQ